MTKGLLGKVEMVMLVTVISFNLARFGESQFVALAKSFWAGRLNIVDELPSWGDTVLFRGNYYWPGGPMPAVMLMPGIWLWERWGGIFRQGYLVIMLVAGVGWLTRGMAKKSGFGEEDAQWLAMALLFGSAFLGVALVPWSWWMAHVVAVFWVMGAIGEYTRKRRYGLIGLFMGLALLTRVTAGLGVVFFGLAILKEKQGKMTRLLQLGLPMAAAVMCLGAYNYVRFGSVVEQGYAAQMLVEPLVKARDYGLFSLKHIPGNLYYMFLASPEPVFADGVSHVLKWPYVRINWWGMSMLLTSPYLIKLVWGKYKNWETRAVWLTVGVIATPILLYYGIGWRQFGYRYALDFLPWLHWLLIISWVGERKLTEGYKVMITGSMAINCFLLVTGLS